jgi:hypothetical protein
MWQCCPLPPPTYGSLDGPAYMQPKAHLHPEARHARNQVRPPRVTLQQTRHRNGHLQRQQQQRR